MPRNWDYLHACDFSGTVPALAFGDGTIDLDEHSEVHVRAERIGKSGAVWRKATKTVTPENLVFG